MPDPTDVPHGPLGMLPALLAGRWTACDRHMTPNFPVYELSQGPEFVRDLKKSYLSPWPVAR